MRHDPWEPLEIRFRLTRYEYEAACRRAEEEGHSSGADYIEDLVRAALLKDLDSHDVPFLPARVHQKRAEQRKQEARNTGTDPDNRS